MNNPELDASKPTTERQKLDAVILDLILGLPLGYLMGRMFQLFEILMPNPIPLDHQLVLDWRFPFVIMLGFFCLTNYRTIGDPDFWYQEKETQ